MVTITSVEPKSGGELCKNYLFIVVKEECFSRGEKMWKPKTWKRNDYVPNEEMKQLAIFVLTHIALILGKSIPASKYSR